MLKRLYLVYDVVAQMYVGNLFQFPNDGSAVRSFSDALANSNSELAIHPSDFEFHYLGMVNLETGELVPEHAPVCVVSGKGLLSPSTPEVPNG